MKRITDKKVLERSITVADDPAATIAEAIHALNYATYKHSRDVEGSTPDDWYLALDKEEVDRMENRYQKERHANVHPVFRDILEGVCDDS